MDMSAHSSPDRHGSHSQPDHRPIGGNTGYGASHSVGASSPQTVRPGDIVFESYAQAIEYLNAHANLERTKPSRAQRDIMSLDRIAAILHEMGDPQQTLRFAHIAGSKGKGSTTEMLASIMRGCGYSVGQYMSPHLVSVRERIRLGGPTKDGASDAWISEDALRVALGSAGAAAERASARHGPATYFELLTAAAIRYFADEQPDLVVLETGMGGRLDATSAMTPEVCGITSIQLEHQQVLGHSLQEIAAEKAGIFKPGVAAFSVEQAPAVAEVLRSAAARIGAPLQILGEDIEFSERIEHDSKRGTHARLSLSTGGIACEHMTVPLLGEHQAQNCALAIAMSAELARRGMPISVEGVAIGLASTPRNGRCEVVSKSPTVIVDGAHNPESVQALMRAVAAHFKYGSMVVVFGCASDKDIGGMLHRLAQGADKVIFTRASDNPRAAAPAELERRFKEISQTMCQSDPDVSSALKRAREAVAADDLICVTGSFYVAGEAKSLILSGGVRRESVR